MGRGLQRTNAPNRAVRRRGARLRRWLGACVATVVRARGAGHTPERPTALREAARVVTTCWLIRRPRACVTKVVTRVMLTQFNSL